MKNIRAIISIAISCVIAIGIFIATNWTANNIRQAFSGDVQKALSAFGGVFLIYIGAAILATFLLAHIITALIRVIKSPLKLVTILALICAVVLPLGSAYYGYLNITGAFRDGANTAIDSSLEKVYGSDYKAKVTKEVDKQVDKMTPDEKAQFEKKTGVKAEDADKLIESGEYTKLLGILNDSGVDVKSKLESHGISLDSPLGKLLIGE